MNKLNSTMNFENRKSVYDNLKKYCYFAKDDETIELTEWGNGEGFDVTIGDRKHFSLSHGELDAINYLRGALDYGDFKENV